MNLNDIFSNSNNADNSVEKTTYVKFDYKSQFIRFRFLEELDSLRENTQVSHWVNGVGMVKCNLLPIYDKVKGTIFLWDGWSRDKQTGVKMNKKPEHNCLFCQETRKAKEEAGGDMAEVIKAGSLHRRSQSFIANVAYEVLERKPGQKRPVVVKELDKALLRIRINDLFSDKGKGEYKTLTNFSDIKGTLMEHWFIMNGESKITPDDPLSSEEKGQSELSDGTSLFELMAIKKPLEYKEGLSKYMQKKGAVEMAEPIADDDIAF